MKVCVIANNSAVESLPTDCDLYIHFNSAIHWDKRDPTKRNVIAVRKAYTVDEAKSWRPYPNTQDPTAEIWAVGRRDDINKLWESGVRDCLHPIFVDDAISGYPESKSPTSGYVIVNWFMGLVDEITTVGFDLAAASYYKTSRIHALDFERKWIANLWATGKVKQV